MDDHTLPAEVLKEFLLKYHALRPRKLTFREGIKQREINKRDKTALDYKTFLFSLKSLKKRLSKARSAERWGARRWSSREPCLTHSFNMAPDLSLSFEDRAHSEKTARKFLKAKYDEAIRSKHFVQHMFFFFQLKLMAPGVTYRYLVLLHTHKPDSF